MAINYRLTGSKRGLPRAMTVALIVAVAGFTAGCEQPAEDPVAVGDEGRSDNTIMIIVNLDVGIEPGSSLPASDEIAKVRSRFIERIGDVLSDAEIADIRTYTIVPAVALQADAELIRTILEWPEVKSISADRLNETQE